MGMILYIISSLSLVHWVSTNTNNSFTKLGCHRVKVTYARVLVRGNYTPCKECVTLTLEQSYNPT